MLVLSRKAGEEIVIGDNVTVTINRIAGNRVTIGIQAPESVSIVRGELEAITREFADEVPASSVVPPVEFDIGDAPLMQYRAAR